MLYQKSFWFSECAFELWLHSFLLDSIFLQSGTHLSLNMYYSFYIYLEKCICMYVYKQILRALAHTTNRQVSNSGNKPDLCRSEITLFNETSTSELKHPKFAGIMTNGRLHLLSPNKKTCSGHLEPGTPEGCTCVSSSETLAWRAPCHHLHGMTGWSLGYMRDKSWVLWFSPHV